MIAWKRIRGILDRLMVVTVEKVSKVPSAREIVGTMGKVSKVGLITEKLV